MRVLLVLSLSILCVKSANILAAFTMPSISHQVVFQPIWKELSLRGHNITVLTPNPLNDPSLTNLTEIDLSHLYVSYIKAFANIFATVANKWRFKQFVLDHPLIEYVLDTEEVKDFLNNTGNHFDVVLAEYLQPGNSFFSTVYNCPLIAVTTLNPPNNVHRIVGNPTHPVLYPDFLSQYNDPPTFFERVDSFLYDLWLMFQFEVYYLPRLDSFIKKRFGENMPYLGDTENNASILLINTSPVLHKARPLSPGVIEMAGVHLKPKNQLPKRLKLYLDNASEGVIYFSLGSNVKSAHLDPRKLDLLLEVFAQLPYKVLWKFENDTLANKPLNVEISKWFPQQDIFGHPNLKLFITQGGLQSLEEAIYNEVPLLALPFFADQHALARRITFLGIGKHLGVTSMTKEEFRDTLLEVANNPRYKENVAKIHRLLEDRPMTGLENAIWWTEYVIRHEGAPYFKSPLAEISWIKYLMLDVLAFLLVLIILAIYILYNAAKFSILMLSVSRQRKKKEL